MCSILQYVCSHMETGVFMLFGGRRFESSSIIEAYSQTFHIPYVSPSFADNVGRHLPSYQLHMRPSHTRALVDVIEHFGWRNFHYVYDSDEGLYRIQEIIRTFESKRYKATVRMRRLVDVYNAHEELRALDKLGEAENHTDRLILLDLSREEHYHSVLKQIREVGMNKHGYCYVLGTMDFLSLEMGRYQHGGVNITGFQLVNYSSPFVQKFLGLWSELDPHIWPGAGDNSIHIDAALAVDAITVIQKTLSQLIENSSNVFKHTFRRGMVYNYNQSRGVPCDADPPIPWMHGAALMDGIRNLHFSGVTGNIEFDEYGFRKNYKFDVYNVGLNNGPNKIGEWSTRGGVYTDGEEFSRVTNTSHEGKVYVVTSVLEAPFLMLTKGTRSDGKPFVGNERYEGYCGELTKRVFEYLGKSYRLKIVEDGLYGQKVRGSNNETTWNGMIGEILHGKAELAVAPLTITSDREETVDFSKPFMDVGISIMIKKPEIVKPGVFSFMQPFTLGLWLCLVFGYISVGLGIFLVSRYSHGEWKRNRYNGKLEYNKFNLANSLWFAMGSMMLQGSDDACPRSAPGRIIGGAWWFAVLITISSYTANLAAFLTIEKLLTPIESADDLVKQTDIAYGTLASGSTQEYFMTSNVQTYKTMWYYMESANPSVFVKSMEEGIKRVRDSKGKYAFLLESVYNEYANNQKPCNTMKVGHNLNSNHYGIATRKYLSLRDDITLCVLKLTEDGVLEKIKKNWWVDKGECGFAAGNRESKKKSLSLSNVAGIYFILIGGLVFAIIIGVCEFLYIKSKPGGVPSAVRNLMVYMMPGVDSPDQTDDTTDSQINHKLQTNGPASPANGNAQTVNYFSYEPTFSPPTISVDLDANTSV
ncbi:GRIA2-like protein [Mya arenaria]|uniref:GRIA2-like protein n=1 Tax=Mya arenaria TaxID=6604 RepID=A0ABY7DS94_MYAAR|nr:GRIA2-like protein [Mya arenaria]